MDGAEGHNSQSIKTRSIGVSLQWFAACATAIGSPGKPQGVHSAPATKENVHDKKNSARIS